MTNAELQAILARNRAISVDYRGQVSSAHSECAVKAVALGKAQSQEEDSGRFAVRITSRRCQLADEDALVGKYVLDALRFAGIVPSDSAGRLDYSIRQEKVASKADERTVIEVEPI